jgi:glycosyltransferase involved in cell wall biosynthesis
MTSICMAVYNGSKYIGRQIESILLQMQENDELIIVDDASTDTSLEIIASFDDHRIKVLLNPANQGPRKSFEKALMHVKGDYVFLADQDDVWLDDKMVTMISKFQKTDVVAVVCDATVIDSEGKLIIPSFFTYRNSGSGFWKNFCKNTYLGCCMCFRANLLRVILPFPERITQHDEWIGLISDLVGKVYFVEEQLLLYRRHSSNASSFTRFSLDKILWNRYNMLFAILVNLCEIVKFRAKRRRSSNA